jgi:hypothetical protein
MLADSHKGCRIRVCGLHAEWKNIFAEELGEAAELIE